MNKQPEQTAKTREKIMEAFWELYRKQGMNAVTVGAVMRKAGLNRGTFYAYFLDLRDLLDQLEDELIGNLEAQVVQMLEEGDFLRNGSPDLAQRASAVFMFYNDQVIALLGDHGDPQFSAKIQKVMRPALFRTIGISEEDPHADYLATFLFSAMVGLVSRWHANGRDLDPEEYLEMVQTLMTSGLLGYLGESSFK